MVIGHNFGSVAYRKTIGALDTEGESKKSTWRHLEALLFDAKIAIDGSPVSIENCFMTNWFIGLLPGKKNVGTFVERTPDSLQVEYEGKCVPGK